MACRVIHAGSHLIPTGAAKDYHVLERREEAVAGPEEAPVHADLLLYKARALRLLELHTPPRDVLRATLRRPLRAHAVLLRFLPAMGETPTRKFSDSSRKAPKSGLR